MNRMEVFAKSYQSAIDTIAHFRDSADGGDLRKLTNWMLTTDANTHGFLSESWASMVSTAEGFAAFLDCVYHAVYDDGDLTVVSVNGEPRIAFVDRHAPDFRERVLTDCDRRHEARFGPAKIEILDIDVNDFGDLYDPYDLQDLQRRYAMDAGRNSVEFADRNYREYSCWNENWSTECAEQIQKWARFYGKTA